MAIKNKKINNRKGFTMVEVIVAIVVFVIVMAGSAGVFASSFKSYKSAKNVNENMKNAQFAMNLMSKTFRTSSVKQATSTTVIVFDYSQSSCIRYVFNGTALTKATATAVVSEPACNTGAFFSAPMAMTSGTVTGSFRAVSSAGSDGSNTSTRVGLVTVTMEINSGGGTTATRARIQSTSSLRDYTVSNVGIDPNNAP
jgi:prepilin-type N-terminal cleavage/methylation domain-containing protein